jgi:hypothetical protein
MHNITKVSMVGCGVESEKAIGRGDWQKHRKSPLVVEFASVRHYLKIRTALLDSLAQHHASLLNFIRLSKGVHGPAIHFSLTAVYHGEADRYAH